MNSRKRKKERAKGLILEYLESLGKKSQEGWVFPSQRSILENLALNRVRISLRTLQRYLHELQREGRLMVTQSRKTPGAGKGGRWSSSVFLLPKRKQFWRTDYPIGREEVTAEMADGWGQSGGRIMSLTTNDLELKWRTVLSCSNNTYNIYYNTYNANSIPFSSPVSSREGNSLPSWKNGTSTHRGFLSFPLTKEEDRKKILKYIQKIQEFSSLLPRVGAGGKEKKEGKETVEKDSVEVGKKEREFPIDS